MQGIKAMFSNPKKAAVTIACLVVILVMMVVCIVYVVNANAPAAENSSIGREAAQNFAFADAGVDPVSAQAVQVKFEHYQGEFVYEVEFIAGDTEYEYKINAADGSVVKKESKTVKGPGGTALPSSTITLEKAREIALADAGVAQEQAVFTEAKEDMEGVVPVYEFEFYAGNVEYEYEINAQTGAVYSKKTTTYVAQDPATPAPRPTAPVQTVPPTAQPTQPPASAQPQPTPQPSATAAPQPTQQGGSLFIGSDAAKNAALADAGVSAGEARFTKVRMDYDDGVAVYEIEFYTSTHEYEYEINAKTGAIRSREVEAHSTGTGGWNHSGTHHAGDGCISADEARAAALRHAGCSADQVVFTKTELDYDDGVAVYEIEFRKDGMEYEFEIDAVTREVLKYEVDQD